MKGFLKFSFFLLALASVCLWVSNGPIAEAATSGTTDCAATIMPDTTIHIPAILIEGHTYSADMQYMPSNDGIYWFGVGNIQSADGVQCDNPSLFSGASGKFLLVIPSLTVGADRYRAVLEFDPTKTANAEKTAQTIFRVDGMLKVRQVNLATDETFEPFMLPVQVDFNHTQHVGVGDDIFYVDWQLKGTVQLGAFRPNNENGQVSFSYITGPANGTLDIVSASCGYKPDPNVDCTCVVKTVGSGGSPLTSGWITVNSLEITPVISPWGVTLNYNIGIPDSSMILHIRCCVDGRCTEGDNPFGNAVVGYYKIQHADEYKSSLFEASYFSHSFVFSKVYSAPATPIQNGLWYSGTTEFTLWPAANLLQ